ncbi:PIN domain-containing protein [Candidatus Woesearchaeota archaeon]|nr:PIN domain-containing protein [Candidatus Woesearchaeota archaeon]
MILETSFLIDYMKGKEQAINKMNELIKTNTPITIATPSIFELFSGLEQSSKPIVEAEKIKQVLQEQSTWPLNEESARMGGQIHGNLISKSQEIEAIDAMIAGIATQRRETLLTRNTKHFSRVPGIKLETY